MFSVLRGRFKSCPRCVASWFATFGLEAPWESKFERFDTLEHIEINGHTEQNDAKPRTCNSPTSMGPRSLQNAEHQLPPNIINTYQQTYHTVLKSAFCRSTNAIFCILIRFCLCLLHFGILCTGYQSVPKPCFCPTKAAPNGDQISCYHPLFS